MLTDFAKFLATLKHRPSDATASPRRRAVPLDILRGRPLAATRPRASAQRKRGFLASKRIKSIPQVKFFCEVVENKPKTNLGKYLTNCEEKA
jgi:hypothetical protein